MARVVLLLGLLALASAQSFYKQDAELASAALSLKGTGFGSVSSPDCSYFCSGDKGFKVSHSRPNDTAVCWGTFKMWCKKTVASKELSPVTAQALEKAPFQAGNGNLSAAFFGYMCRGHMVWAMWEGEGERKEFVLCEGGSKSITGWVTTCPHTGETYKKMRGSWALGTSSAIMSSEEAGDDDDDDTPTDINVGNNLLNSPLSPAASELEKDEHLRLARAALARDAKVLREERGFKGDGGSFGTEARDSGVSGEWRATKRVERGAVLSLDMDEAEADEQAVLHPTWSEWFGAMSGGWKGAGHHEGDSWEVLCNRRPAFLHGLAPCWGNFTFSLDRPAESTRSSSLRRLTAMTEGAGDGMAKIEAAQAIKSDDDDDDDDDDDYEGVSSHMDVECDGLYTGIFMSCHGLQTAHSEFTGRSWSYDKYSICSGHQKVHFAKSRDVRGMGVTCRGKRVVGMRIGWEEDEE